MTAHLCPHDRLQPHCMWCLAEVLTCEREALRAIVARVWERQAPSSRWLEVPPPEAGHAAPASGLTERCTDVTRPTRPGGG